MAPKISPPKNPKRLQNYEKSTSQRSDPSQGNQSRSGNSTSISSTGPALAPANNATSESVVSGQRRMR